MDNQTKEKKEKKMSNSTVQYHSQAASYEAGSKNQQGVGIRMINMLNVEKGATVLDLGCGTGCLTKVLSERVGPEGKVVAVDPDGERLKIARENHSASNITYIQADDQTFPQGQYDLIFCNIVIHWIRDKKAALERIYENLRPGGCFAFTTSDGVLPVPEIGKEVFNKLVGPNFLNRIFKEKLMHLEASEYERLGSAAGFIQTSMTIQPDYPKWNNLDQYIDAMYGWFQGEFDPAEFDQEKFQEIKREYGNGPVTPSEPINHIHAMFVKPIY